LNDSKEIEAEFIKFIAKYGRSYASKDQMSQRFEVFKQNYEVIEAHNRLGDAVPFTMGVNQFTDMTDEEFEKEIISNGI